MKLDAFIIHLARATARRPQVELLAGALPCPVTIVDAVDGSTLTEEAIATVYRKRLHRPAYPFQLRSSEIACFLSHRKVWQAIVAKGLDFGLVIEDDVRLEQGFGAALAFALGQGRDSDYIRFPRWLRGENGPTVVSTGDHSLIAPRLPGLGTQAALVGRQAAEKLLAFTERFDRPIDTTLQMDRLHGVRMLALRPIVIEEIDQQLGGSVISKKVKSLGEVMSRTVHRAVYRSRIRAGAFGKR